MFINNLKRAFLSGLGFSKRIYLDYASLTPIDPKVLKVMEKYSGPEFANPSSWYREGVAAKNALQSAHKTVADFLHAHPDEIVFTSGGTESNNIAILGAIEAANKNGVAHKDMHVIVSEIEHSSVLETLEHLKILGVAVDLLKVNEKGLVSPKELKEKIRKNTILVSVMIVNNEIGTIEPIKELAKVIRQYRSSKQGDNGYSAYPIFHTDAAQGALYLDLNIEQLGVDLLTLDGTKTCGPRGVGALFVKRRLSQGDDSSGDKNLISPIVFGGGQEKGMRSGTENVPGIMGFAYSLELAKKDREKERVRLDNLRSFFVKGLKDIREDIKINTSLEDSAPHILNISIPGIDNEFFLLQLDAKGIACSTKSSCLRDSDESYVLKAVGADSQTSIRFSFGRDTSASDIKKSLSVIRLILSK